jgi:hypothetical protein
VYRRSHALSFEAKHVLPSKAVALTQAEVDEFIAKKPIDEVVAGLRT